MGVRDKRAQGLRALEVLSMAFVFVHMHTVEGHRDVSGCTGCVLWRARLHNSPLLLPLRIAMPRTAAE